MRSNHLSRVIRTLSSCIPFEPFAMSEPTKSAITDPFFKGYAKPGPIPPRTIEEGTFDPQTESLDAISGHWRIFQLKNGHRFSTDDVVAAWYATANAPCARRVLDLGSGLGSVAMVCAWRLQGAKFVTVEAQAVSVALAKKTAKYNGIEDRYEIRSGDFRDPGVIAEDELFDLITGSPPYFPLDSGPISEHPQKQACRFEIRGTVADYILTASKHLALGGMFTLVFPIQPIHQEKRVLDGAKEAGMTIVRFRPVALKEGEPPLLGLFCMVKNEHLPERLRGGIMWKEPALTIRCKDGTVHPEYVAVKLSFGFPP